MITRIALVGCGIWGKRILRELVVLGACVDVYELNPLFKQAARELGAAGYFNSWNDLSEYDGVVLATPSSTHRRLLEQILPSSVPVFVEKPLTTNLQDALALGRLKTDKLFMMHTWTYHPGILMLRDIARSGELGALLAIRSTRANWTSPRTDTDTVWNLVPHDITIAKIVLGYIPAPQFAVAERHAGKIRSFAAFLGKEPFFLLDVSNRHENKVREVRVNFEGGVAVFENDEIGAIRVLHGDANCTERDLRTEYRKFPETTALQLELLDFITYLRGGAAPRCTFKEGLEVVETIHTLVELAGEQV